MIKKIIKTGYDYSLVDTDTKGKLINFASNVKRAKGGFVKAVIDIGGELSSAQEVLAGVGRDGQFRPWVELECSFTRQTAYNYISAYRTFGKCKTVLHFDDTALYLLASDSTPEEATKEAVKLTERGTHVTAKLAKEIVERHKPKPEEPPATEAGDVDTDLEDDDFDPSEMDAESADIESLAAPYRHAVNDLNRIRREFVALAEEEKTGAHLFLVVGRITKGIDDAKTPIAQAEPVEVCEKCEGLGCEGCQNTGFWTKGIMDGKKK